MTQGILSWKGPTAYTDGQPYGAADHKGYDIEINGQMLVSIPFAWNTANTYSLDAKTVTQLKQGNNTTRVRTVAANGQVSEWTPLATFSYASIPNPPTALSVA